MAYVIFLAAAVGVVMGGALLARAADELAESLRLQRVWIGSVLVAGATSMPELVVDVSAIRVGAPDLAVGDLFGSSMANMLILGILGLAYGHRRLLRSIVPEHALTGTLAISLTMLAVLFILAGPNTAVGPLGIGPYGWARATSPWETCSDRTPTTCCCCCRSTSPQVARSWAASRKRMPWPR